MWLWFRKAPHHCGRHRLSDIRTVSSFPRSLKTFRGMEHEDEDRFALILDHWRSCLALTSHCLRWQEAPSLSRAATLMIRPTQHVAVATALGVGGGMLGSCCCWHTLERSTCGYDDNSTQHLKWARAFHDFTWSSTAGPIHRIRV